MKIHPQINSARTNPANSSFLIFPPFADPTWAYVGLPALKGFLARRGIDVSIRDYNIEGLYFLLAGKTMADWRQRLTSRLQALNRRQKLTLYEQMEYWRIAEALPLCRDFFDCLAIMRDPAQFYNQKNYLRARDGFEDLFQVLAAVYFPFRFSFNRADHLLAPWDFKLLAYYIAEQRSPFDRFYRQQLADLGEPRFIGLSLTFVSQIPETFYLCRLIKELFPACFVMLGGPCIDQIVRNSDQKTVSRIFDYADAVGLQEGENTLEQLLPLLNSQCEDLERFAAIPNLMMKGTVPGSFVHGPALTFDLNEAATPDYADLELDRYLAPERLLLYSPTRGCYWNKCSFCSYGFNQSGRHAYREIPVARAVADLQAMQREFGVVNFYLSADVLAPTYALALAERIIAEGLDLRWSTDLRIETSYTPERCRLLYQSGLRAVAFGIESGSDRVLRLMNKGIDTALIRKINRNFHQAGISTSWMTFLNHPGETGQEAGETLALIDQQGSMVDQFIAGEFNLTPGSLISCHPEQYGIEAVYHTKGDVFRLFPLFNMAENSDGQEDEDALDEKIDKLSRRYHLDHYPWAGSISTHHSFLYLVHSGPRVFAKPWPAPAKKHRHKDSLLPVKLKFSPADCRRREDVFMERYLAEALQPGENGLTAPLSFDHFQKALQRR
ncbi:MAG: radical SAM protein [Proteobacteria bacterium]|nr:radical SAM protein [Pseudomonadota bacterium]MBU1716684.1 radical SAM protein [Pseudomonadota bacterium]